MRRKEIILLIEVIDDLLRLNDALKALGGSGYQEQFSHIDNVYEVIKNHSVYAHCTDEEREILFYSIVEEVSETPKRRLDVLVGGKKSLKK